MKRYKLLLIVSAVLIFAGAGTSWSQSSERVRNKLLLPADNGARVIVNEDADANAIIKSLEASEKPISKIHGYRIRIFFDNSQDARAKANVAIATFKEIYPDIPAYPSYDNPSFKVTVGNCISEVEAVMLWGKVKNNFDKAFRVQEDIPLELIIDPAAK